MRTFLRTTAVALTIAALAVAGCGGDDDATPGDGAVSEDGGTAPADLEVVDDPEAEVERRLTEAGLEICDERETGSDISGSYEGRSWSVDTQCSEDALEWRGYVDLDLYNEAATASAELNDPSGDAYRTWLIDPTTRASTGQTTHPEVLELIEEAFKDLPAGGPFA